MLKFETSPEHDLFRQTAREFAEKEIAPGYLERSKSDDFPWELYRLLGSHGFLGLSLLAVAGGYANQVGRRGDQRLPVDRGGRPRCGLFGVRGVQRVLSGGAR